MSIGALKNSSIIPAIWMVTCRRKVCACPRKTSRDPNLSPWADLEALRKWEVKSRAEVSTARPKMRLSMHTKPLDNGWRTY